MMNNDDYLKNIYKKYDNIGKHKNNEFYKKEFKTRKLNFSKIAACFVLLIGITAGITYAVPYINNKIIKNPEYYSLEDKEITEEDKVNIISKEEAYEKVKKILQKLSYQEYNLDKLELTKNPQIGDIYWTAITEKYRIEINALNGDFVSFSNDEFDDLEITAKSDKANAEKVLNEIKEYLNIPDDYKTAKLERHTITEDTCLWQADLCKEYDGVYNWYQDIRIIFVPEVSKIKLMRFFNYPFDNNEVILSAEDAIKVVMIENNYSDDEDLNVEFAIEQLNYNYTENSNNLENKNNESNSDIININTDTSISLETDEDIKNYLNSYKYYKASKIVRKVWKVTDLTIGKTEYFVDATTGEIIDIGEYGIEPPGINIEGKNYYRIKKQNEIYDKEIKESDLGEEIYTLNKNDSIVKYNEKFNGAKVYKFLPSNSDSLIVVKRNEKYILFKFDRYNNFAKNISENILNIYNITNENDIKIEILNEKNKKITDKDDIAKILNIYKNTKEVSSEYYFKDIQKYYKDLNEDGDTFDKEDIGPYTNAVNVRIYTKNGTYISFSFQPVSHYFEAYSKYYKLSDDDYNYLKSYVEIIRIYVLLIL